jgi:hypothetical protein
MFSVVNSYRAAAEYDRQNESESGHDHTKNRDIEQIELLNDEASTFDPRAPVMKRSPASRFELRQTKWRRLSTYATYPTPIVACARSFISRRLLKGILIFVSGIITTMYVMIDMGTPE